MPSGEFNYLSFGTSASEYRAGYDSLMRVNHNASIVLFYFANGTAEAVPLRALGGSLVDRSAMLEDIQDKAVKADKEKRVNDLVPVLAEPLGSFCCRVEEADVLIAERYDSFSKRRKKAREPFSLFVLAFLLYCLVSGFYGCLNSASLPESFRFPILLFLILECIAAVIGLLIWYKPSFLSGFVLKKTLRAGLGPRGYIGERRVSYSQNYLEICYGSVSLTFPRDAFSSVISDGKELLFFQNESLVAFLPLDRIPNDFIEHIRSKKA